MQYKTSITGFPRIGENRELKKALEKFWAKKSSEEELYQVAKELREKHWLIQQEAEIDLISSNDFSLYDNMLDTIIMLNAIPKRFTHIKNSLERYFAMARGCEDSHAMEMSKWFNTNYHYIVPELNDSIQFRLNAKKIINEYMEAKLLGIKTKINIIGPITFLALSKTDTGKSTYDYYHNILEVYKELITEISKLDETVCLQIEEPIFVTDVSEEQLLLLKNTYNTLASVADNIEIIVATYFEHSIEAITILSNTPIWGIAIDLVAGKKNLNALPYIKDKVLIAGIIDGRNIWTADTNTVLAHLNKINKVIPKSRIIISTSCSLLHLPYTIKSEPDSIVKQWLAFAYEKLEEVKFWGSLFHSKELSKKDELLLEKKRVVCNQKRNSELIHNLQVKEKFPDLGNLQRVSNFAERIRLQKSELNLPILPITTIGSFPQTPELRRVRRNFRNGIIDKNDYEQYIKKYIDECISIQDKLDIDVFVHGEPERTDMVEYFAEMLEGFHFSKNGWVQSYGSRCVKPPIIYGDISRPNPMTVKWFSYAQNKTCKPVKGMLTGPVTILNWSFARTDIPRSEIAKQIAIALAGEVNDLQNSGAKIIQVDEAAFKEGYPLRRENIKAYEQWAIESFRITVSKAYPKTQIHTHMCYSEFNHIMATIQQMDADVITIETSRSGNELLKVFQDFEYKNEIGPGVYDIHSPVIPTEDEFRNQIESRLQVLDVEKMWINPDCGLKTRTWKEVLPALTNMVNATKNIRKRLLEQ